ncbi:MAG: alanine--tRNA ligase [Candidatus Xenobia bacterium]
MKTSKDIRQQFIDFFVQRGHQDVPSAPVVPRDDPTLMFTNAGMNQFKPYFLGLATPENRRIVDTQKCIRVSGKHNDIEEVGYDTYHHTFFEMLGNWSVGDYYKKEAIAWAWELLTKVWGLPKERLYATIFGGSETVPADDEAKRLWTEMTDIDPSHVKPFGKKENFWMMGDTGPCGPCSEIHIDLTPDGSGGPLVNEGHPLVMELWNLVFIQFNAEEDGSLRELPARHVDTGMGFERACAVIQCTDNCRDFTRPISNYDTDVFTPLLAEMSRLSGQTYTKGQSMDKVSIAMRVCADHVRMISFSVADGATPGNEGRGYVIRRLLRRAARHGRDLGFKEPFLWKLVGVLAETMGHQFPEIVRERQKIEEIIKHEETLFGVTLDRGMALFEEAAQGKTEIPGEIAFRLYDTFGFPLDLTQVMARERGITVDEAGFNQHMTQAKEKARAARKQIVVSAEAETLDLPQTPFLGYETLVTDTLVKAVLGKGNELDVVLEETPFYAEMGGQVGDTGKLGDFVVTDTQAREGIVLHHLKVDGDRPEVGQLVTALVDRARRLEIQRHHTATHLLHWALREVLGKEVRQQGSLVAAERLRFDFGHREPVKPADLKVIEGLINDRILENEGVSWFEVPMGEKPESVIAFFGDTYGARVRVLKIGGEGSGRLPEPVYDGFSMELCGGTHLRHTGEMGPFRIVSETGVAAGVRRIEAVVGNSALASIQRDLNLLTHVSDRLAVPPAEMEKRVESLLETLKKLEKELATERHRAANAGVNELIGQAKTVGDVPVIAANLGARDNEYLLATADALRDGGFKGVAVLAGTGNGKVSLVAMVDKDLTKQGYHAGKLIGEVAKKAGGGGGGRPDLAQAGGKDPAKVGEALDAVPTLVGAQKK